MERERALLIETLLDGEITPAERQVRIEAAQRRLLDLERMVLRDDKLVGRNTPQVRRAGTGGAKSAYRCRTLRECVADGRDRPRSFRRS